MKDKNCRQDGGVTVPPASSRQVAELRIRNRGRLPHWEKEGSTCFITFRLNDSVPSHIADGYRFERENIIKTAKYLERPLTEYEIERLQNFILQKSRVISTKELEIAICVNVRLLNLYWTL